MLIAASTADERATTAHRAKFAYVYVRQSSLNQVKQHQESTELQYRQVERAVALGWPHERVQVIDEDLDKSGAGSVERQGFQKLIAEIGLGNAGLVVSLDASRLARNNRDWHQLLELCSVFAVLIADGEAIGADRAPPDVAKKLGNYPLLGRAAARRIPNAKLVEFAALAGTAAQTARGVYDLKVALRVWANEARGRRGPGGVPVDEELTGHRRELARIKVERQRLEFERRRGTLLDAGAVIKTITDALAVMRQLLLSIAPKLAPKLALINSPARIRADIEAEIAQALQVIVDADIVAASQVRGRGSGNGGDVAAGEDDPAPAADADDQSMG